ncbi:MAG TPA: flagellar hook-basal body complex protein FliE [Firmicutes bacterium]|jgi:flagellar hook-basal body complex protein FliE|nr:flagellar hook-basal body complex protein FliE [Bacillota bacterium]
MKVHFDIPTTVTTPKLGQSVQTDANFQSYLRDALSEVNTLQHEGDVALTQLLTGDIEFHDAMIIAEKANLALQLTMTIRTKLLEAYQEIMRMQV